MSSDRPSRPQLELLSDLQVDRQGRSAPPVAPAASSSAAPPPAADPGPPRGGPAFELRVTPLSWSLPRLALLPGGTGLAVTGGPVRVALLR